MTEQIILKLGCRPMNDPALSAGFEFAKGARLPVTAYFMEDETLFQASRFSFSNEVRVSGHKRGLEVHEVRREVKIAMRALSREVQRRSEHAQIESEFVTLNGEGPQQIEAVTKKPNIIVLGEHQSARQLARDFEKFRVNSQLQGVLMAGPRAGAYPHGPLVVVVHSLEAWTQSLPLLESYLSAEIDVIIYSVGDVNQHRDAILSVFDEDYAGDVQFEHLKRCDQARLLWGVARVEPGVFFTLPGAPYISTEKDVEALLRLLPCAMFVAL